MYFKQSNIRAPTHNFKFKNDYVYANLQVEYGTALGTGSLAYFGQCCVISSSQLIQCFTSIGTGNKHAWKVKIGLQDSSILNASTSYGNPIIRDYERVTVPVNQLRTDGNDYVNLSVKILEPRSTLYQQLLTVVKLALSLSECFLMLHGNSTYEDSMPNHPRGWYTFEVDCSS